VPITNTKDFNLIKWWDGCRDEYETLSQYALDTFAIPATATECERTFDNAKKLVLRSVIDLSDEVIEACECLKSRWDNHIVSRSH
jgi:hypothetical protein